MPVVLISTRFKPNNYLSPAHVAGKAGLLQGHWEKAGTASDMSWIQAVLDSRRALRYTLAMEKTGLARDKNWVQAVLDLKKAIKQQVTISVQL